LNPIVFHIVSGDAFFSGTAMLLTVVWLRHYVEEKPPGENSAISSGARVCLLILFLCGIAGIVFSSTPMPIWLAGLLSLVTLVWCGTLTWPRYRSPAAMAMTVCWGLSVAMEIPWRILPATAEKTVNAITVIGDSVSAGMEEGEAETWPSLLAKQHPVVVQDLSHVGETAGSALKRAQQRGIQHDWVIAEIGGNDVLGSTSPSQFETALEALLRELTNNNRKVVMFELPLIPLYHRYGMIQRSLATKFDVALVPKRYFLSILADGDATLDSIHLSQSGHQRMSDLVWRLMQPRVLAK
jgi:acyl-CoA thioesterase-1